MAPFNRRIFRIRQVPYLVAGLAVLALMFGSSLTWLILTTLHTPADQVVQSPQTPVVATRDPEEPLRPGQILAELPGQLPGEPIRPGQPIDAVSPVKAEDHHQPLVDDLPTNLPKAVQLGTKEYQVTPPSISVDPLPAHLRPQSQVGQSAGRPPIVKAPANPALPATSAGSSFMSGSAHQITASTTNGFAAPVLGSAPIQVSHILPPSQGMLRINPLRLPAVPTGTLMEGKASWYGAEEHGTTTACMVTYDMYAPTLATRELPCGTPVLVIANNGRMATATTTDWGPAEWTNRRFDLSPVVFEQLASLKAGVIDVQVITLDQPKKLKR